MIDEAATTPAGEHAARLDVRRAGHCALCDRLVVRAADGTCDRGHPAEAISGNVILIEGESPPRLPRFNWAAFLVPPVWGPFHGLWVGAIFLPLWLFADSIVAASAGRGVSGIAGSVFVGAVTIAAQAWFAKRANGLAWRRVSDHVDVDAFVRQQKTWVAPMVALATLLYGWGVFYRMVLAG